MASWWLVYSAAYCTVLIYYEGCLWGLLNITNTYVNLHECIFYICKKQSFSNTQSKIISLKGALCLASSAIHLSLAPWVSVDLQHCLSRHCTIRHHHMVTCHSQEVATHIGSLMHKPYKSDGLTQLPWVMLDTEVKKLPWKHCYLLKQYEA